MRSSRFFKSSSSSSSSSSERERDQGPVEESKRNEKAAVDDADRAPEVVNLTASSSGEKKPGSSRKSSPFFRKRRATESRMSEPPLLKSKDTCAICLGLAENAAGLDKCTHIFCLECISQWALVKLSCPYCKADFRIATCLGAGGKSVRFDDPAPANEESDGEEYGYYFEGEEDEDSELDGDYVPGQVDGYGYVSDDGFIVDSADEEDDFSASGDEEILTVMHLSNRERRMRRRRNRGTGAVLEGGEGGAVVDLVSPDGAPSGPRQRQGQRDVVDLVTPSPDAEDDEQQRQERRSPIDFTKFVNKE